MHLLIIALAPVLIIACYIYFRDKYEKEPLGMLFKSLLAGVIIFLPVYLIESFLTLFLDYLPESWHAFYTAFIVAGFTEESLKFAAVLLLVWKNSNFNEQFDGIVYASFVSLGFAGIENILFVVGEGAGVGLLRAFTSVPMHALTGIFMGYQLGQAKFMQEERQKRFLLALLIPILFHGTYNFLLLSGSDGSPLALLVFVPFFIYAVILGFKRLIKPAAK